MLQLKVLEGGYAVVKLGPQEKLPAWVQEATGFLAITRTAEELSIVCAAAYAESYSVVESGWRIIEVVGPLDFSLTGILAGLAQPLAREGISIFAISTYNTDYILVKESQLTRARSVLKGEGYNIN